MDKHKSRTIYSWKNIGVISEDFDKLYENHMNINNCQICNVKFDNIIKNNNRTLDHDHATGLYRQSICDRCNKGFDRKFPVNNTSGHKYISFRKRNGINVAFEYSRIINNKRIRKCSVSKIKLIAFSFIQQLKSNI